MEEFELSQDSEDEAEDLIRPRNRSTSSLFTGFMIYAPAPSARHLHDNRSNRSGLNMNLLKLLNTKQGYNSVEETTKKGTKQTLLHKVNNKHEQ